MAKKNEKVIRLPRKYKNLDSAKYEIVKYDNDFSILNLNAFKVVERRFLMALLYKCKEREDGEYVYMNKDDFMYLGVYKPGTRVSPAQAKADLLSTINLCSSLRFHEVSIWAGQVPEAGTIIPLFDEIKYDFTGDWAIKFSVSKKARPYLNSLFGDFTRFPLVEFQQIDSKYQQDLYRYLKQFRRTGWWRIRKDDFIKIMNIPKSYRESDIDKRIINPALKRLYEFFPNLECKKHYVKSGHGYKVASYEFTFEPEKEKEETPNEIYSNGSLLGEFEIEFGRSFTSAEEAVIKRLEDEYGITAVLHALDEAAVFDARDFNFIENVLMTWKLKGLTDTDLNNGKR